jgi:hypothetical protein
MELIMKNLSRKNQILTLITRLADGGNVSNTDILLVLTKSEYDDYLESWNLEKKSRVCDKPKEIQKYQKLLTRACLIYKKMDVYSCKSQHDTAVLKRLTQKVDITFAAALEYLHEAIDVNGDVCLWLDRDPFDVYCLSPSPSSIPRVIGSKSPECLDKRKVPFPTYSKRQVKENALFMALERVDTSSKDTFEAFIATAKKRTSHPDFSGFS